jgi:DnaJ-class molecular chaperone
MRYTTAGYGDECTFPPCTGHPSDPRTPEPELVECPSCHGSGRMPLDPDIGTDQECFVCDGSGEVFDE